MRNQKPASGKCKAITTYEYTDPATKVKKTEWRKGEIFKFWFEGRFCNISNEENYNRFPRGVFNLNFKVI